MIDTDLMRDLLRAYPAQPATAVWRTVEVGALLQVGIPTGRGLDLGCGDGKLTNIILDRTGPRQLVGVDSDPLETDAARKTSVYEVVHTTSASSIPERSGTFDFAIANSVLEHVPNLAPILKETARLLRPGGTFLFTVPGPGFHNNLRGSLFPWVSRTRYLMELDKRLSHLRYLSMEQWRTLCSTMELQLEDCPGYLSRDQTRTWETLSRLTGGLLYTLRGKKKPPIAIQRELGLRQMQNNMRMPSFMAEAIGAVIRQMVGAGCDGWIAEDEASCLLVHGTRL